MKNKMKKKQAPQSSSSYQSRVSAIEQLPHYFKHLKNTLEAHRLKAQSINMRNQILERQNRLNYTLELERITGILSQTAPGLRHDSIEQLKRRKTLLEELGSIAVG